LLPAVADLARTSPNIDVQAEGNAENDRRRRIIRHAINHRRSIPATPAAAVSPAAAMITAATAMPTTAVAASVLSGDGRYGAGHDGECRGYNNPRRENRGPTAFRFGI
jgi:hypothetical protein